MRIHRETAQTGAITRIAAMLDRLESPERPEAISLAWGAGGQMLPGTLAEISGSLRSALQEFSAAGRQTGKESGKTGIALRAAQRLLESTGGTLVLENLSEAQRAALMSLIISALSEGVREERSEKGGAC